MKHLLLLFLLITCIVSAQQKDQLTIYIDTEYGDEQRVSCTLYQDQQTIAVRNFEEPEEWKIDSIAPGNYSLQVQLNGRLAAQFYNIGVKQGYRNYYNFTVPQTDNDSIGSNYGSDKAEMLVNVLYGNNTILETHQKQNQLFLHGLSFNYCSPVSKYYSIGQEFGATAGYTQLPDDTARDFGHHVRSDYYLGFNVHYALFNRFTFYDNKKYGSDGLKIDLGIAYNLPLVFREYRKLDSKRVLEDRHIHRFNDFYALFRIGYKYVGVQAEYNLTTFLKAGYAEIPKYRVGLVFYIPNLVVN